MRKKAAILLSAMLLLVSCAQTDHSEGISAVSGFHTSKAARASSGEDTRNETEQQEPAEQPAAPLVPEQDRMMETIQTLCKTPRPIGSKEEAEAAQLLSAHLQEYGYESELEPFSYNITRTTLGERYRQARDLTGEAFFAAALPGKNPDGSSQNVVGRQPWEDEKENILVLSAHYDSTVDSLGVIDNAAGVAVVLEAARILAAEELPLSLRIVFFGGEEEILIGSRQHL